MTHSQEEIGVCVRGKSVGAVGSVGGEGSGEL